MDQRDLLTRRGSLTAPPREVALRVSFRCNQDPAGARPSKCIIISFSISTVGWPRMGKDVRQARAQVLI
jgi:hypothetical protein